MLPLVAAGELDLAVVPDTDPDPPADVERANGSASRAWWPPASASR
jgi:hypothetical protein